MLIWNLILLTEFLALKPIVADTECPTTVPISINGNCYRFQTDPLKFKDALENCPRIQSGAKMISIRSMDILERVQKLVNKFINSKLENAKFWIGLTMTDRSLSKPKEDRIWTWNYDDVEIVQKDYTLWDEDGGPKKAGLTCTAVDGANDFMVKPLDCGGARLPIICRMAKGKACRDNVVPFLTYGDYCLAVGSYADAYGKVAPGCSNFGGVTQYFPEMKSAVTMAAKNSFMGGGIFMYMRKTPEGQFHYLDTGEEPDPEMWEDGEPRDDYDCVGLSLQSDNTLKLKTMNCEFMASSLCIFENSSNSLNSH